MSNKKCFALQKLLKVLLFFAAVFTMNYVQGFQSVFDTQECDTCLNAGGVACRSAYNNSITYCCDPDSPFVANCTALPGSPNTANYDRCSTEVPPSMVGVTCPFMRKICQNSWQEYSSDVHVSPVSNTYTVVGAVFEPGDEEQECYYQIQAMPYQDLLSNYYDYQIDVNITSMQGVKAKMHNGTLIYFADDETQIDFVEGQTNFTLNATLAVKGTIYLPGGTYLNNVFLQFAADPEYEGNRFF